MTRGAITVAYGTSARREATALLHSLQQQHPELPVAVVSDAPLGEWPHIAAPDADPGARLAKLSLDALSPWDATLYLDADTRVRGDIMAGFDVLADGWEMVIAPSGRQGIDALGNCDEEERARTFAAVGTSDALGLQAGVLWFRRCPPVADLFSAWVEEWMVGRGMDQGALLRALQRVPVRLWLLGRPFNGGAVVEHRFGQAARRVA